MKASNTYWKVIGPDHYEFGDILSSGRMIKVGEGGYAKAFTYAWQIGGPPRRKDRLSLVVTSQHQTTGAE